MLVPERTWPRSERRIDLADENFRKGKPLYCVAFRFVAGCVLLAALCAAGTPPVRVNGYFTERQGHWTSHGGRVPVVAKTGSLFVGRWPLQHRNASPGAPRAAVDGVARWFTRAGIRSAVKTQTLTYPNIYPGISLRLSFTGNALKSDYLVDAHADPAKIGFRLKGAPAPRLEGGELVIGELRQPAPIAWQDLPGGRHPVDLRFHISGHGWISFDIGSYDPELPLVIDPYMISWSTILGGSGIDTITSLAPGPGGTLYAAGYTDSSDFPAPSLAANRGGVEAFVMKIDPASGSVLWATWFGGSFYDAATALRADTSGNVFAGGYTSSPDFPSQSGQAHRGGTDGFLARFDANGAVVWSTCFGGSQNDRINGIALSSAGDVWAAGETASPDLPTASPLQATLGGTSDTFFARFSSAGTVLNSSFFGGAARDVATAVAVDSSNEAYFTGSTWSTDFPTSVSALQPYSAGAPDAFVAKISSAGAAVRYSTYLGGAAREVALPETGSSIAVDSSGSAWVTGTASSFTFPTSSPLQPGFGGGTTDAFVSRIASGGSSLLFSSLLGGTGADEGAALALHPDGSVFVGGSTTSGDLPLVEHLMPGVEPSYDGFVVRINSNATSRLFSTYLGGSGAETVSSLVLMNDTLSVAGTTTSAFLPSGTLKGDVDSYIASIQPQAAGSLNVTTSVPAGSYTISGTGCQPGTYSGYRALTWTSGAQCTITVPAVETSGETRWRFNGWGDGATANPRVFTASASLTNLSIQYLLEHRLSEAVNPTGAATLTATPASADGWYASGTSVQLDYAPVAGFQWTSWSGIPSTGLFDMTGPVSATANFGCSYTLTAAAAAVGGTGTSLSASFTTGAGCPWSAASNAPWIGLTTSASGTGSATLGLSVASNPGTASRTGTVTIAGQLFTVSQSGSSAIAVSVTTNVASGSYAISGTGCEAATYTGPRILSWTPGTQCTITPAGLQTSGETRLRFTTWHDGSAAASRVFLADGGVNTIGLTYSAEYHLIRQSSPPSGGSTAVTPTSTDGFYAAGTNLQLSRTAASGYTFRGWTGIPASGMVTVTGPIIATANFTCNTTTLSSTGTTLGANGATLSVTVTAPGSCSWLSSSDVSWITVNTGLNGTGSGSVSLTVGVNGTASARTGSATVAGRTWTVNQNAGTGTNIAVSLATSVTNGTYTVSGAGCEPASYTGSRIFTWTPGSQCTIAPTALQTVGQSRWRFLRWSDGATSSPRVFTASSSLTAISIEYATEHRLTRNVVPAASGSVSATPGSTDGFYLAGTNLQLSGLAASGFTFSSWTGASPGGTLVLNAPASVTASFACAFSLSCTSNNSSSSGGALTTTLTAGTGCAWSASSNASWLTITSALSGTGTTSISASAAANTSSSSRAATVTVGGQTWTITQSGVTSTGVTVTPSVATAAYAVTGTGCQPGSYTGARTFSWVPGSTCSVNPVPVQTSGESRLRFVAWTDGSSANPRIFTASSSLNAIGINYANEHRLVTSVNPGNAGAISVSPVSADGWYAAGSTLQLTATPAAGYAFRSWTGVGSNGTLLLNSPASITGDFACSYTLTTSTGSSVSSSGGPLTTGVTAGMGCAWTAIASASWITVSGGTNFNGSASVNLFVEANSQAAARSGSVTIAGQQYVISQSGLASIGVTITTSQPGGGYSVSGAGCSPGNYSGTAGLSWVPQSQCVVAPTAVQTSGESRWRFVGWIDGSTANPRTFTADVALASIGINYLLEHRLTHRCSPPAGGSTAAVPASSDGWYASGTPVQMSVVPAAGYAFTSWSGIPANGALVLSAPATATANLSCVFGIGANQGSIAAAGGTLSTAVSAGSTCGWTAVANASWISVSSGGTGTGPGSVAFSVATNASTTARTGTVTIAGQTYTVTQAGVVNLPVLLTSSYTGASYTVSGSGCQPGIYVGSTALTWVGNSTCSVAPAPLLIAGATRWRFLSWSDGSTSNPRTFTAQPGLTTVSLNYGAEHRLTSSTNPPGAGSVSAAPPSSDGFYSAGTAVQLSVAPSGGYAGIGWSGVPASGNVVMNGPVAAVYNLACAYALGGKAGTVASPGGTLSVAVSTAAACSWSAGTAASWISISSGTIGSGSGGVTLAVAANTGLSARSATVTVAGQIYTVTQSGVVCGYTLSATSGAAAPAGGPLSVGVSTASACSWSATSGANWATVTAGATGSGSGTVALAISPNTSVNSRTTVVTIAGQAYTIVQAGVTCTFALNATSAAAPGAAGKTSTVRLSATGSGCTWSATSSVGWIELYPSSGTNGTDIFLTVYPSMNSQPRTGVVNIAGQTASITQAGSSLSEPERFIQFVYYAFLGRSPTAAEIAFQLKNSLNQGTPRPDFVSLFFNSEEFNIGGRFVAGMYVGLLDRDPEYSGWLFQRRALSEGFIDQTALVRNFMTSAEYTLKFGNPDKDEFVRLLYRYILLREPAPSEVSFQSTALGDGSLTRRVEMARTFFNSAEFRIGTGPRLIAFLLYSTLLQRDGSPEDRASQAAAIRSGFPMLTLFDNFIRTQEFQNLVK